MLTLKLIACGYLLLCSAVPSRATKSYSMEELKNRVKDMFYHAYNGYMKYAYPLDELRPLSCDGHDTWGSYSLTLVDALDTLAVFGNWSEFNRASRLLLRHLDANKNVNISVFETNIRVIGGLISAHLLSRRAGFKVEPTWPCSGPLLRQAEIFATKLLPAFDTPTGMPYGTVNLALNSVPNNETPVTCVATIGTLILEFGTLSRLTGDPRFEDVAIRALRALWNYRSSIGLLGNHINVLTGRWTASESTIGAGVDSLFEYLVKGSALFRLPELDYMFREYKAAIDKHLRYNEWHFTVSKDNGYVTKPVFQGLEAFWPGMLVLTGNVNEAVIHLNAYHRVWRRYGFIPEAYNIVHKEIVPRNKGYLLRPEFIESVYYVYRATKDPHILQMGIDVLTSIERVCRTECGFATVMDVKTHQLENRMESFFLAETTKYLYLLFDENNFIHDLPGDHVPNTTYLSPAGVRCYPELGGYIFNTEAHLIDPGALNCCSLQGVEEVIELESHTHQLTSNGVGKPGASEDGDSVVAKNSALPQAPHEFEPLVELLNIVDTTFQRHLSPLLPNEAQTDTFSWLATGGASESYFVNDVKFDPTLVDYWSELRNLVSNSFVHSTSTNRTQPKDLSEPVIDDYESVSPPLLTCPYPPFHQRFILAGQYVSTKD